MTIERCSMNISPKKLFNVHCSMLNCHLKICGRGRVIAVPVDDFTVLVFQESQKTAVRSILEAMASRLDGVAGLDGVGCHAPALKGGGGRCVQSPDLRLAGGILDFYLGPRLGDGRVCFLDDALSVYGGRDVIAGGFA